MIQGTIYRLETGELGARFDVSDEPLPPDGYSWVSGHWDPELYYVVDGCPVRRPVMPISIDGLTFSGLPVPASVRVGHELFECDDGIAELEFMVPGVYRVEITKFPFQIAAYEVETP